MLCARNDIVLLPFPFTDQSSRKVRPAVVVGIGSHPGDLMLVPLTSRLQQADLVLVDWQDCGLNVPSGIKAQIATIESDLVLSVVGRLTRRDIAALTALVFGRAAQTTRINGDLTSTGEAWHAAT